MSAAISKHVDGEFVVISGTCEVTKERYSVRVPFNQYMFWARGGKCAVAMPSLTDEEREFVISGTTPVEFTRAFIEAWEQQ